MPVTRTLADDRLHRALVAGVGVREGVMGELTTTAAMSAVAYGRAPKHRYKDGRESWVNRRIVCADGFTVSVQASSHHYANDRTGTPYWSLEDPAPVDWPFRTFEVGNPSEGPAPSKVWDKYEGGGIWAYVPRHVVASLLNRHGGAVAWEAEQEPAPSDFADAGGRVEP